MHSKYFVVNGITWLLKGMARIPNGTTSDAINLASRHPTVLKLIADAMTAARKGTDFLCSHSSEASYDSRGCLLVFLWRYFVRVTYLEASESSSRSDPVEKVWRSASVGHFLCPDSRRWELDGLPPEYIPSSSFLCAKVTAVKPAYQVESHRFLCPYQGTLGSQYFL